MKFVQQQKGFSIVEVLVAISILLIGTLVPLVIAGDTLQNARVVREKNTAFMLAQEGLEGMFLLRANKAMEHINGNGNSWDWYADSSISDCRQATGCGLDFEDENVTNVERCNNEENCRLYLNTGNNRARYTHNSNGTSTPYVRIVYLDDTTDGGVTSASVEVVVKWNAAGTGDPMEVRLKSYLNDIYNIN